MPVSKVRMPRSHRTMSRLPRCATYSAAISHSSYVAVMPRLSITGCPAEPTACSSAKFCMLRVPTCSMSAYSRDQRDVGGVDHLGDDRQAGLLAHLGEDPQALLAEPLEGVRAGARLVRAAAQQRRAGGLGHPRRGERLLRRLDRARPGDEGEGAGTDRHAADLDRGRRRVVLAADQLVGLADPDDLADPGHRPQVEALEGDDVADQPDDGALHAAADEGRPARLLHAVDDGLDLLRGRRRGA